MPEMEARLRQLPPIDVLARAIDVPHLSTVQKTAIARIAVDAARAQIQEGQSADPVAMAAELAGTVVRSRSHRIINATGVLLHTNLGRAPISARALEAAALAAGSYTNTELDMESGNRGARNSYTVELLRTLTGAEDALIVNNNAAGVLLALSALAPGKGVPVSRGELIEIGGSYRLPEVMAASGARMIEVGTTNKTRIGDYETALQINDCAAMLRVHAANYEISGFVDEASVTDLVALASGSGIPLIFDIGSGLLDAATSWLAKTPEWLTNEPGAVQALAAGTDLVLFSGDKLLGGPQAGIIVGSTEIVGQLRTHPIARSLRVSAPIDAALAATLEAYANDQVEEIPLWRMATLSPESILHRAEAVAAATGGEIEPGYSLVGAGSAPSARLESFLLIFKGRGEKFAELLDSTSPVLARRAEGNLVLDLRTVEPEDDKSVVSAIKQCL